MIMDNLNIGSRIIGLIAWIFTINKKHAGIDDIQGGKSEII